MPGDDRFIEIQQRPRRAWSWRWWQVALVGILACGIAGATTVAGVIWYFSRDLPSLDLLQNYQPSLVTTVYSDDRQPIGQFFIERRILTPLAQIPWRGFVVKRVLAQASSPQAATRAGTSARRRCRCRCRRR